MWCILGLSLAVSALAINNQSLWIDEALTAVKARQPTLAAWWQAMVDEKASDLQMPLYMVYVWAYEKLFGSSEWVLRSANIPWLVPGMVAFVAALASTKPQRLAVATVTVFSPFAWYYLNEARPYAMQLGASLLTFASLYRLSLKRTVSSSDEPFWVIGFLFGVVVLCGSSMLGMIWAASAVAVALVGFSRSRIMELLRLHRFCWPLTGGCVLLFGCYYLWTLKVGARASGASGTDWKNLFFIGYELLGFSGLGPGRLEIRQGGLGVFQRHWLELVLYCFAVLVLFGAAIQRLLRPNDRKWFLKVTLIVAIPALVLVVAGLAMHFRILGRHFIPLMPVVLFLLSSGMTALWSRRSRWTKVVVGGFCLLSLLSCLSLRFAVRHEKDNYRDAAAFARAALQSGRRVWWNAAGEGAAYYQVGTTTQTNETDKALWLVNPTKDSLSALLLPQVIIASKPDIFDNQGALAGYIERVGFRKIATLPAIAIWQRNGE